MTSPNLKRPLDPEMATHPAKIARRCNNYLSQPKDPLNAYSVFKDPATILPPLSDEVAAMIKDELHRNNNHENHEQPLLTVRQTQACVEKLIKDREQKLRDEYDKILRTKLAEHTTELLNKINYLNNPYLEPTRMPSAAAANLNPPPPPPPSASNHHPSMNALAAAYRSAAAVAAVANTAAAAATSLPDPLSFAAAHIGAANGGHPSALTSSHLAYNLQQQAVQALQAQNQRAIPGGGGAIQSGPVLLASNLDEQLAIPEALFTLFGVFGDVIRVKILFNKKDNALIQMADANQAQVAQGYLDKQKVFGKIIRVTRSKHQLVQMPREGNQSDAGLTKDFTNSPLHRFKIPGSRNYLNIYPPSNTLHISNIPATIDENDINKAFKEACGFEFTSFKFFPKDRKMALIKFNSIEHATIALIKMHNSPITEETNLRVSFSKSIMQQ